MFYPSRAQLHASSQGNEHFSALLGYQQEDEKSVAQALREISPPIHLPEATVQKPLSLPHLSFCLPSSLSHSVASGSFRSASFKQGPGQVQLAQLCLLCGQAISLITSRPLRLISAENWQQFAFHIFHQDLDFLISCLTWYKSAVKVLEQNYTIVLNQ